MISQGGNSAPLVNQNPLRVGLIGAGIGASRTPKMHVQEAAALGLSYTYELIDTAQPDFAGLPISNILDWVKEQGFAGVNVTFPFKQEVIPHLDELSQDAKRMGAVNTVVLKAGRAIGYNTDLFGFAQGFEQEMVGADLSSVAMFGAGGAGAAVANALLQLGAQKLYLIDILAHRATRLAQQLQTDFPRAQVHVCTAQDLAADELSGLVNSTPIGMEKSPGLPVPKDLVQPHMFVADVIYFPLETQLLRLAQQRGCRLFSGAHMAIFQAVQAFELFSGITPDATRMRATFDTF